MHAREAREAKRRVRWMAPLMHTRPHPGRPGTRAQRAARGRRTQAPRPRASDDDGEPEPPGDPARWRFEGWPRSLNRAGSGGNGFCCLLHDDGALVAPHAALSPAESAA
jgi:hypothetical protein